jgi:hypothetical protein
VFIRAEYFNASNTWLGAVDVYVSGILNTTTWLQAGGRLTTPANTAKVRINFFSYMTSGWAAFDDVSLVQVGGGGANLAPNPSFESGNGAIPANWYANDDSGGGFLGTNYFRSVHGTTEPHSGSYAFSMGNLTYANLSSDPITVTPNARYDLYVYARGYLDPAVSNRGWILRAQFLDGNNNSLSSQDVIYSQSGSSSYLQYGGQVTVPANAARVTIQLFNYLTSGWMSFDEVSLTLAAAAVTQSTQYYYLGGQRVARRTSGGSLQYLFGDHLGSTAVVTDSSFSKVSEARYAPWGQVRFSEGTALAANAFAFTGQRQETGIGLDFYQARWYDLILTGSCRQTPLYQVRARETIPMQLVM